MSPEYTQTGGEGARPAVRDEVCEDFEPFVNLGEQAGGALLTHTRFPRPASAGRGELH